MLKKYTFIFFISLTLPILTHGQGITRTPYSQFGFGDVELLANARMMGMGGTGVSMIQPWSLNLKNPAVAAYTRRNVIFEGGFYGQSITVKTTAASGNLVSGNIQYLALNVPIQKKFWGMVTGISPYSNANSRYRSTKPLDEGYVVRSTSTVEGGLNQIFMLHGIKLPKGFALGLGLSYVFGTIQRSTEFEITDLSYPTTKLEQKDIYRFLEFKPGFSYLTTLNGITNLSIGATATFNKDVTSNSQFTSSVNSNRFSQRPILYQNQITNVQDVNLPQQYAIGVSMDRNNKWNAGVDYTLMDYSKIKSYTREDPSYSLTTGHRFSLGGEYIPNINDTRYYFNRIVYRSGLYYNYSPLIINNTRITDMGLSFGLGLPLPRIQGGGGTFNLAFVVGRRGTTDNNLVQENYFRFFVGINIIDTWFVRYKND